jgi:hypothetical protein
MVSECQGLSPGPLPVRGLGMSHNLSLLPRELHARGRAGSHLDRPVRVGLGQWQKTPAQLSDWEIDMMVAEYADRLAKVHSAQVRLYRALLATDDMAAEFAAPDLRAAVAALPEMPAWPDTDEELIARLRGKFSVPPTAPRSWPG